MSILETFPVTPRGSTKIKQSEKENQFCFSFPTFTAFPTFPTFPTFSAFPTFPTFLTFLASYPRTVTFESFVKFVASFQLIT